MEPICQTLFYNQRAKETLATFVDGGRFPHAILLEGPNGSGKTLLARWIAAAVNCRGEHPPCGSCSACRKILQDKHPDVRICSGTGAVQGFHISLVREIRESAFVLPNEAEKKVYILCNTQEMSTQAQNALLKILEEPPEHCMFILTVDSRAHLLPTILSRTVLIRMEQLTLDQCVKALETLAPSHTADEYEQCAFWSGNTIGQALDLLEHEKERTICDSALQAARALCGGTEFQLLAALSLYERKRELMLRQLQLLETLFSFLMLQKYNGDPCPHWLQDLQSRITTLQASRILDIIEQARGMLLRNGSGTLVACTLCGRLRRCLQ